MDFSNIPKISDLEVEGKRVLIRVDFNVPLDETGKVLDDTKIRTTLPTINYLLEQGAKIILMSHLGRPAGKPTPEYSLEPVASHLAGLLDEGEVYLTDSCVGDGAKSVITGLRDGQVAMLENLRFHAGEVKNDDKLTRELASFANIYVNDAFGSCHRKHASTYGVAKLMHEKSAGLLLEKELASLNKLFHDTANPYVAILGGAKITEKITLIERLLERVSTIIIGGAMANTFLAAKGYAMGNSTIEADKLALARDILFKAEDKDITVVLPKDLITGALVDTTETRIVSSDKVPENQSAFDIGPKTCEAYREIIKKAGTVFWNGPMGVFDKAPYANGTLSVAKAVAGSAAFSVVGGADTVAAVRKSGLERAFDHISTGGGATLQVIEGKILPAITALIK